MEGRSRGDEARVTWMEVRQLRARKPFRLRAGQTLWFRSSRDIRRPTPPTHPGRLVSMRRLFLLCVSIVSAAFIHPTAAFAQTDVVRGRIIGPDSLPVERATVTVTSLTGNVTRQART